MDTVESKEVKAPKVVALAPVKEPVKRGVSVWRDQKGHTKKEHCIFASVVNHKKWSHGPTVDESQVTEQEYDEAVNAVLNYRIG